MKLRHQSAKFAGWYSEKDIAAHFSVSRGLVWKWVQEGLLPPGVVIGRATRRWPGSVIQALDEQLRKQAEAA